MPVSHGLGMFSLSPGVACERFLLELVSLIAVIVLRSDKRSFIVLMHLSLSRIRIVDFIHSSRSVLKRSKCCRLYAGKACFVSKVVLRNKVWLETGELDPSERMGGLIPEHASTFSLWSIPSFSCSSENFRA